MCPFTFCAEILFRLCFVCTFCLSAFLLLSINTNSLRWHLLPLLANAIIHHYVIYPFNLHLPIAPALNQFQNELKTSSLLAHAIANKFLCFFP